MSYDFTNLKIFFVRWPFTTFYNFFIASQNSKQDIKSIRDYVLSDQTQSIIDISEQWNEKTNLWKMTSVIRDEIRMGQKRLWIMHTKNINAWACMWVHSLSKYGERREENKKRWAFLLLINNVPFKSMFRKSGCYITFKIFKFQLIHFRLTLHL